MPLEAQKGEVVQHYPCLTSTLDRWVGNDKPRPFYLRERDPVHMVQEARVDLESGEKRKYIFFTFFDRAS